MSSVTYDVAQKQSVTHNFSSKYGKSQCFPVNFAFSCGTGDMSGRKMSHSTSLWAESIHEKASTGSEQNGPRGATMEITLCIREPTASSLAPTPHEDPEGPQLHRAMCRVRSCLADWGVSAAWTPAPPPLQGPVMGPDGSNFSARSDPWAMFWTMLI